MLEFDDVVISEAAKDLIQSILVGDAKARPTIDQMMQHEFLNGGVNIPKTLP